LFKEQASKIYYIIDELSNSKSNDIFMMNSGFLKNYKDVLVKPL